MAHPARKQYWSAVIADFHRSGLTQGEFCRRRRISVHSFRSWLYSLRHGLPAPGPSVVPSAPTVPAPARSSAPAFLPVHVRPPSPATSAHCDGLQPSAGLELVLGPNHFVRVSPGFDPATLHQLLDVLEDRP